MRVSLRQRTLIARKTERVLKALADARLLDLMHILVTATRVCEGFAERCQLKTRDGSALDATVATKRVYVQSMILHVHRCVSLGVYL